MPLLAAATDATDPSMGLISALILLLIAARRSRGMREPGANRKGYSAGLLLYGSWIAVVVGNYLNNLGFKFPFLFALAATAVATECSQKSCRLSPVAFAF